MIALVANFVYNGKQDEMYDQIAGVSEHRTDKHIKSLTDEEMEVENLVYYRRETHYFIMTLKKGALKKHNLIYEVGIIFLIVENVSFLIRSSPVLGPVRFLSIVSFQMRH